MAIKATARAKNTAYGFRMFVVDLGDDLPKVSEPDIDTAFLARRFQ
jgi:hypothetical protein